MKGMIDSSCGISFYGKSCLSWLVFLLWNFLEFSRSYENSVKTLATDFAPLFLLHCYNQVAKIVTLIFGIFCLLQKCLRYFEKKKFLVNIVEPKLQETILYHTKRDAQLEPYIAPSVPNFQHCPMMI